MRITTATKKINNAINRNWSSKKNFIFQGGQGAGKTYSLLQVICSLAYKYRFEVLIASEELTKMKITIIKDFQKIMQSMNIFDPNRFKAETEYRFENSSFIKFIGLDKVDIGKGLRCDIVFINEANKTGYEKVHELISRARKRFYDFNPNTSFWIDEYYKGRDDSLEMILTFEDNEALSQEERNTILDYKVRGFKNPYLENYDFPENIKSEYWANIWRVYGLGKQGRISGLIYTNWKLGEFDHTLPYRFGLDFGFSNDPDALVKAAIDEKREIIYAQELMYNKGQSSEQLFRVLDRLLTPRDLVYADSADSRLVADLAKKFNVKPTIKWKVTERIKKLQSYDLIITPDSKNLIKELENYKWHDKKSETPIDEHNDLLDALGYSLTGGTPFEYIII